MQYFVLVNPERDEYFDPPLNTYPGILSGDMEYSGETVGGDTALTYLETPVDWDGMGFQPLYNKLAEYGQEAEQIDNPQDFAWRRMDDTLNAEFGYAGRWATDRTCIVGDYDESIDPSLFHSDQERIKVADELDKDPDDLNLYEMVRAGDSPYRDVTKQVQREVQKLQMIFRMKDLGEGALAQLEGTDELERMDRAFSNGLPGELTRVIDTSDWENSPLAENSTEPDERSPSP